MGKGGAERVAATLCNGWIEERHDVWLVPTFIENRNVAYAPAGKVNLLFLADHLGKTSRLPVLSSLVKIKAIRALVRNVRPDVIVSFLTNVNIAVLAATMQLGIPVLVSERTDPAGGVRLPWHLRVARQLWYRAATAIVVQTESAAGYFRRSMRLGSKVCVIHNPLPIQLESCEQRAVQPDEGGLLVAMGRLSAEKNFDGLIKAFQLAFARDRGWSLEIWGDGPLRTNLQTLIIDIGLQGRITLKGNTDDPWRMLVRCQIFVLSSVFEGFPNSMLEAMALGLPCVATDCQSGPRVLSDDGRVAILVRPNDTMELSVALRTLADNRTRRQALGSAGATYVRAAFAHSAILGQWRELFESIEPY